MGRRGKPGSPQQPTCACCKQRKAYNSRKLCRSCLTITEAEGTRELYGEIQGTVAMARMKLWAKKYNKLILEGLTQAEVAVKMGMKKGALRSKVVRYRAAGLKLAYSLTRGAKRKPLFDVPLPPKPPKTPGMPRNGHGTGKWGIKGCKCEPCILRNRQRRNQLNQEKAAARREAFTAPQQ
jgi:hypothetical protein